MEIGHVRHGYVRVHVQARFKGPIIIGKLLKLSF